MFNMETVKGFGTTVSEKISSAPSWQTYGATAGFAYIIGRIDQKKGITTGIAKRAARVTRMDKVANSVKQCVAEKAADVKLERELKKAKVAELKEEAEMTSTATVIDIQEAPPKNQAAKKEEKTESKNDSEK